MRILFSHSYFMYFDPKQWELEQPYPPLGTIFAASFLREAGHEVFLFDTMFEQDERGLPAQLDKYRPDVFVIYDDGFNYLTKMCLTNMREAAFRMQEIAKQKGCTVIVSSSDSTDHFEKYLDHGADAVIKGEAEITLLEIISLPAEKKNDFSSIAGIAFRQNGQTVQTPKRQVMKDLDALPLPAWDLVDIKPYRERWMRSSGELALNMATTRGCPYKCNWCAKPIYGNRYNSRSPENVIQELKLLREKFQVSKIWFSDDIFGLKPGWVNHFADLVEKEQISFRYKIQSRADLLIQENYVADLARSGCETVWLGAESGSQRILDAMDKGTTVEQIYEAVRLLKKHGIRTALFLQFGYLGETIEDIHKTIGMLNDLLPDDIGVSVSYPLPGTKFYEMVKHDLEEKSNWSDSDDLHLMFRNTYSPDFYRQLHRFVHKNYRKHQAYESIGIFLKKPSRISRTHLRRALSTLYYIPASFFEKRKLKQIEHAWN
ncbi:MAG: radical SAM protein [Bacteroidetes bacterium]|nr:MAG: radical SAM protein [Bacteroidota bacterium]